MGNRGVFLIEIVIPRGEHFDMGNRGVFLIKKNSCFRMEHVKMGNSGEFLNFIRFQFVYQLIFYEESI